MTSPLVSVVITTYNTGQYVTETVESALAQTHRQREIIVVDDGSTDDTTSRLKPYLRELTFLARPHRGLAAARNEGLGVARGDFIALLDADDLWLPEKLQVQIDLAARHPRSGFIVCDGVEFAGRSITKPTLLSGPAAARLARSRDRTTTGHWHRAFIEHVSIRCPAQTLFPRAVIARIGPFRPFNAQDYDYYLRTSAHYPVTFHADKLVRWRDREESMSGPHARRDLIWSRQKLAVLRTHERQASSGTRPDLERQVIRVRAEAAVYCGELVPKSRATRVIVGLLRRSPWPPTALPYLGALYAPRVARRAHRAAVTFDRWVSNAVGRWRMLAGFRSR